METIFTSYQLPLFNQQNKATASSRPRVRSRSGTFVDNMKLPVHRWFRYSAGFSAEWVRSLIQEKTSGNRNISVLDPFAGIGTSLLASDAENIISYGFETHPFIYRIAKAKLDSISLDIEDLMDYFDTFYSAAKSVSAPTTIINSKFLSKCYSPASLEKLTILRETYCSHFLSNDSKSDLLWLTITSILRASSTAGTAQWQYVLPKKKKSNVIDPFVAFIEKANQIVKDIQHAQLNHWAPKSMIIQTDARKPITDERIIADLVITSPPYPNNYDYADATRLEMTFWGEVAKWKDLQESVRQYLIRSCSQHSAAERLSLDVLLEDDVIAPIRTELSKACAKLAKIRLTRGGRKTYHTMAAAYFNDLGRVFHALRDICSENAELCFVIGDSAPYGVYLHVDEWLGQLALAAGFSSFQFEKIRDRNVKWKNRKHSIRFAQHLNNCITGIMAVAV